MVQATSLDYEGAPERVQRAERRYAKDKVLLFEILHFDILDDPFAPVAFQFLLSVSGHVEAVAILGAGFPFYGLAISQMYYATNAALSLDTKISSSGLSGWRSNRGTFTHTSSGRELELSQR